MQRLTMMTWVNRIPTLVLFHSSIVLNRLVYRKALQEWSNAIDHLMTFLLDWYCLPVRVIDCNAEWLMQHTIDDRPWNPRNPNSMLRNIASHHVPHLVRDSLVVFVSKKFCCRGGGRRVDPGTGWWFLLNYWMSLPVPEFGRDFFCTSSRRDAGNRPNMLKKYQVPEFGRGASGDKNVFLC